MDLQQALFDSGFSGLSDAAALAYGNASVTIATSAGTLWTYRGVAVQFGISTAEALGAAIAAAGMPMAAQSYVSPGIDLSLSETQAELTALAGVNQTANPTLAAACHALMQIGITTGTRWQLWGCQQPQLADITAARAANAQQQAIATFLNEYWNPAIASGAATVASLQALAADNSKWG